MGKKIKIKYLVMRLPAMNKIGVIDQYGGVEFGVKSNNWVAPSSISFADHKPRKHDVLDALGLEDCDPPELKIIKMKHKGMFVSIVCHKHDETELGCIVSIPLNGCTVSVPLHDLIKEER